MLIAAPANRGPAQEAPAPAPSPRTTLSGVYTEDQATKGKDLYQGTCLGCHTVAEHSGVPFGRWGGHTLWEYFDLIKSTMPKDNPNTMSPEEYAQITAYILKLNALPAGTDSLPTDSVALKAITIEVKKP
jgi:S-disulfanyl-L-cysteine oxidoreductase SoxD